MQRAPRAEGHLVGRTLAGNGRLRETVVRWTDGIIREVRATEARRAPRDSCRVADECVLIPGLIDLHSHGGGGLDVARVAAEPDEADDIWAGISAHGARWGATAVVPALVSSPPDVTRRFLQGTAKRPSVTGGAAIVGVHLEGPYLNPERRGAHCLEYLRDPDPAEVNAWLDIAGQHLKMVTLAPELEGAGRVISRLVGHGVIVGCGHTAADFEQMNAAFDLGARHAVHLFNGMSPIHHRHPGPVIAALMRDDVTCEVICDGVHVNGSVVELVHRIKGTWGFCMVTDSISAAGCPDGEYDLGSDKVKLESGRAVTAGGALAGGALAPAQMLQRVVESLDWPLGRAVHALSRVPARILGLNAGEISPGRRADLVIIDADGEVVATIVGGRLVYGELPGE